MRTFVSKISKAPAVQSSMYCDEQIRSDDHPEDSMDESAGSLEREGKDDGTTEGHSEGSKEIENLVGKFEPEDRSDGFSEGCTDGICALEGRFVIFTKEDTDGSYEVFEADGRVDDSTEGDPFLLPVAGGLRKRLADGDAEASNEGSNDGQEEETALSELSVLGREVTLAVGNTLVSSTEGLDAAVRDAEDSTEVLVRDVVVAEGDVDGSTVGDN